jgi:uncharacterized protein YndB with AHSA1/START domain
MTSSPAFDERRELVLTRVMNVPREKLWRAWTEPELLKQWFAPRPWAIARIDLDLRAGGSNRFVMRSPEGQEFPNDGVYLEVVPHERIVFTDAFTRAWEPSAKPFMTAIVTFEDLGDGKTRYTARARHWTEADREAHEKMGFHEGWGQCADQLAALAAKL